MTVDLFVPCYIDQFYPETAFNAIKVLEKCDINVNYNPEQTCCGKEIFDAGFFDKARIISEKFIDDFNTKNTIVGLSPACVGHVKNNYYYFFNNSGSRYQYLDIQKNIFELSDFLVNVIQKVNFDSSLEAIACYHDSCHSLRKYDHSLKTETRTLLSNVKGLTLVELEDEECCGFGGLFSVKYNSISTSLAAQKIQKALQLGVTHIISADCQCLLNLNSYIKKHNIPITTLHLADVLANFI